MSAVAKIVPMRRGPTLSSCKGIHMTDIIQPPVSDPDSPESCRPLLEIVADYVARSGPLARLELLTELREAHEAAERTEVGSARAQGASWAEVAVPLGISKQAAHKRFTENQAAPEAQPEGAAPRPKSAKAWTVRTPAGRPLFHLVPTATDQLEFPRPGIIARSRSRLRSVPTDD